MNPRIHCQSHLNDRCSLGDKYSCQRKFVFVGSSIIKWSTSEIDVVFSVEEKQKLISFSSLAALYYSIRFSILCNIIKGSIQRRITHRTAKERERVIGVDMCMCAHTQFLFLFRLMVQRTSFEISPAFGGGAPARMIVKLTTPSFTFDGLFVGTRFSFDRPRAFVRRW